MAFRNSSVLALIPARGGSKGVPRKNLRDLRGKPLIVHTIEAALAAPTVDAVFVSSDDDTILELARKHGATAMKRPAAAAADEATAPDVVADFARQLPADAVGGNPFVVYLQPTSPLRGAAHIEQAFGALAAGDGSHGLSVVELKRSPYKTFVSGPDGRLRALFDEQLSNANRQSLPRAYYPNGAIYVFPLAQFLERRQFPSNGGIPFIMSESDSVDIDTEADFASVESS